MRSRACGSWLLAASLTSALAFAEPPPAPAEPPAPPSPEPTPPAQDGAVSAPSAPEPTPERNDAAPAAAPGATAPLDERRPDTALALGATTRASSEPPQPSTFTRNYAALPLTLEARFGFNTRLGQSFDDSNREGLLGTNFALGAFLSWNPEYALGIELEHTGLGTVRGLSGQNSIDAEYRTTSAWLGARVFPVRRERLDLFVNLRIGLALQHVNALGTRADPSSITVPAQPFSCSETDGPGFGLGGAVGAAYRLSRRFAFVTRIDATGQRLSGEALGTCADGLGSVASLGGSIGLSFELDTAPR